MNSKNPSHVALAVAGSISLFVLFFSLFAFVLPGGEGMGVVACSFTLTVGLLCALFIPLFPADSY